MSENLKHFLIYPIIYTIIGGVGTAFVIYYVLPKTDQPPPTVVFQPPTTKVLISPPASEAKENKEYIELARKTEIDKLAKIQQESELSRMCDSSKAKATEAAKIAAAQHGMVTGGVTGGACGFLLVLTGWFDFGTTATICAAASAATTLATIEKAKREAYLNALDSRCWEEFDGKKMQGRAIFTAS